MVLPLAFLLASQAAETPPQKLDWTTFPAVRSHATVRKDELAFQSIDWHDRVIDGIAQANRDDKPLVLWLYFGDPRGHC